MLHLAPCPSWTACATLRGVEHAHRVSSWIFSLDLCFQDRLWLGLQKTMENHSWDAEELSHVCEWRAERGFNWWMLDGLSLDAPSGG